MAGEHQVFICIAAMGNVLQGLLNAETARIGLAASAVGFAIHPTRKGALAKATHAISLILPDQRPLFLRDKDKRVVWRLESAGIAKTKPLPRTQQVTARHPEIRSEEHTSELQSLMRISYAVFCLKKKNNSRLHNPQTSQYRY